MAKGKGEKSKSFTIHAQPFINIICICVITANPLNTDEKFEFLMLLPTRRELKTIFEFVFLDGGVDCSYSWRR
jgi:hypothetical protein